MANLKKMNFASNTVGTYYCVVRRDLDGWIMDSTDGIFYADPAAKFNTLAEDPVISKLYIFTESRQVWNDGFYQVFAYLQMGGSPDLDSDLLVGVGSATFESDVEVAGAVSAEELARALPMGTRSRLFWFNKQVTRTIKVNVPGGPATIAGQCALQRDSDRLWWNGTLWQTAPYYFDVTTTGRYTQGMGAGVYAFTWLVPDWGQYSFSISLSSPVFSDIIDIMVEEMNLYEKIWDKILRLVSKIE